MNGIKRHKMLSNSLQYTAQQLDYQGIQVTNVQLQPNNGPANTFQTFWQQSDIDLSRGLDFVPRGNVFARFTHLQNSEFVYNININNATGTQTMGMVRIFVAPRNDERGTPMFFRDQRLLMTELDKFTVSREHSLFYSYLFDTNWPMPSLSA